MCAQLPSCAYLCVDLLRQCCHLLDGLRSELKVNTLTAKQALMAQQQQGWQQQQQQEQQQQGESVLEEAQPWILSITDGSSPQARPIYAHAQSVQGSTANSAQPDTCHTSLYMPSY